MLQIPFALAPPSGEVSGKQAMRQDAETRGGGGCALVTRLTLAQVCTRAAGRGVRAHPGPAGGQGRRARAVPGQLPRSAPIQRPRARGVPSAAATAAARAGPPHGRARCGARAMTAWRRATGLPPSAQPSCREAWEAALSPVDSAGRRREGQVPCVAAGEGGAEPPSFGSKWTSSGGRGDSVDDEAAVSFGCS